MSELFQLSTVPIFHPKTDPPKKKEQKYPLLQIPPLPSQPWPNSRGQQVELLSQPNKVLAVNFMLQIQILSDKTLIVAEKALQLAK